VAVAAPERPAGVPEGGFWNPDAGGWEVSQRNAQGARDGECVFYRRDGSLQSRFRFAGGVQEGRFEMFHPDGSLAREGRFLAGRLEGIVSAHAGAGAGAEPLRACCVPETAARLDLRYESGAIVQEIFYDAGGRPILSSGEACPPRPAGVPEDADYDEAGQRWTRWRPDSHRTWSAAGRLETESEFDGSRRTTRTFDAEGRVVESVQVSRDGTRDGAFLRRFGPDVASPYADPEIREERGTFDRGQAVGTWSFASSDGAVRCTVARGAAFEPGSEQASPAFARGGDTADDWRALAGALRGEGRVREALCAAARAAARDGDREALAHAVGAGVVPLRQALAAERGDALVQSVESTVASILDGLVTGADPAAAFRALGAVLPGAHPAASDFVAASLLLAPERRLTHLTRALVRFQHGDEAGARADVALIAGEAPQAAAALTTHLDAGFRPFSFWPGREPLVPDPALADLGAGLVRDLAEVRATIAVYATRIGQIRAAVRALTGPGAAPAWLPPDSSPLLPDGPVPLRRARVAVDLGRFEPGEIAEAGEPGETLERVEADVDEEIETSGLGVPALLGEAQADWGGLAWLCWSAGLDRVALPEALAEPPLFAVAMKTIVTRCWRAQDRLTTGGLLARTNGVPGFPWEGRDIDELPRQLAQSAAEEYLRARAAFLWLASPDVVSPFQVDLRAV
jgi:antitoxin component YwqK of YwqJK toxin-antitoxin module